MLVGIIAVENVINAFQHISLAEHCDLLELRLDYLDEWDADALQMLFQSVDKPVIATIRKQNQGGKYNLGAQVYVERLKDLAKFSPDYLDIEIDVDLEVVREIKEHYPNVKLIRSCHIMQGVPDSLDDIYQAMQDPLFDEYKLVCFAKTLLEGMRLMVWAKPHLESNQLTCFAFGDNVQITRFIAPALGSRFTFNVIAKSLQLIGGQLGYEELINTYQMQRVKAGTRLYALLGDPVRHSVGHLVHNAIYADQNLDALYIKIQVHAKELADFMALAKQLPFHGFSVTAPHKNEIVNSMASLSDETKVIGAVNTVTREKESFLGFNTDGVGALDALEAKGLVYDKEVLVLGAGGAARAIIYEAQQRGARVTCVNRTLSKAKQLATGLGCAALSMDELKDHLDKFHILINTIPSQLNVIGFLLPKEALKKLAIVMECNYEPRESALLRQAKQAGCEVVYGIDMYINQAIAQMDIWFHETLDREGIKEKIKAILIDFDEQQITAKNKAVNLSLHP